MSFYYTIREFLAGVRVHFKLRSGPLNKEDRRDVRKLMKYALTPNGSQMIEVLKANPWMLSTKAESILLTLYSISESPSLKRAIDDKIFVLRRSRVVSSEQAVCEVKKLALVPI